MGRPLVLAGVGALFLTAGYRISARILEHFILVDPDLRQGIKEFSQWPTIPQLYVKGEFVGGCDIVREMFQAGELQGLMKEKGLPVKESASA